MKTFDEQEFAGHVKAWITQTQDLTYAMVPEITEETDLIATGVLDSMGFIELMLFIESLTEEKIDLSDADPAEFTTMRGLYHSVVNKTQWVP